MPGNNFVHCIKILLTLKTHLILLHFPYNTNSWACQGQLSKCGVYTAGAPGSYSDVTVSLEEEVKNKLGDSSAAASLS